MSHTYQADGGGSIECLLVGGRFLADQERGSDSIVATKQHPCAGPRHTRWDMATTTTTTMMLTPKLLPVATEGGNQATTSSRAACPLPPSRAQQRPSVGRVSRRPVCPSPPAARRAAALLKRAVPDRGLAGAVPSWGFRFPTLVSAGRAAECRLRSRAPTFRIALPPRPRLAPAGRIPPSLRN
jgi:hypothetical protein